MNKLMYLILVVAFMTLPQLSKAQTENRAGSAVSAQTPSTGHKVLSDLFVVKKDKMYHQLYVKIEIPNSPELERFLANKLFGGDFNTVKEAYENYLTNFDKIYVRGGHKVTSPRKIHFKARIMEVHLGKYYSYSVEARNYDGVVLYESFCWDIKEKKPLSISDILSDESIQKLKMQGYAGITDFIIKSGTLTLFTGLPEDSGTYTLFTRLPEGLRDRPKADFQISKKPNLLTEHARELLDLKLPEKTEVALRSDIAVNTSEPVEKKSENYSSVSRQGVKYYLLMTNTLDQLKENFSQKDLATIFQLISNLNEVQAEALAARYIGSRWEDDIIDIVYLPLFSAVVTNNDLEDLSAEFLSEEGKSYIAHLSGLSKNLKAYTEQKFSAAFTDIMAGRIPQKEFINPSCPKEFVDLYKQCYANLELDKQLEQLEISLGKLLPPTNQSVNQKKNVSRFISYMKENALTMTINCGYKHFTKEDLRFMLRIQEKPASKQLIKALNGAHIMDKAGEIGIKMLKVQATWLEKQGIAVKKEAIINIEREMDQLLKISASTSNDNKRTDVALRNDIAVNTGESEKMDVNQKIFDVVEQQPQFPGNLNQYLVDHINYPSLAVDSGIQGKVIVQFVVERDGSITQANVIRGVDPSLDNEALRVVKCMPKWTPGRMQGEPVRVKFTLPITFKLGEDLLKTTKAQTENRVDNGVKNSIVGKDQDRTDVATRGDIAIKTNASEKMDVNQKIFDVVEQQPQFPEVTFTVTKYRTIRTEQGIQSEPYTETITAGGTKGLNLYLREHIHYPSIAQENGIEGKVIVQFVIERDGSITQVNVTRGVDPSLDREAVRVVKSMPKWSPGRQKGEPVRVKFTLPVNFRLG